MAAILSGPFEGVPQRILGNFELWTTQDLYFQKISKLAGSTAIATSTISRGLLDHNLLAY